jgi:hypothetical protein
MFSTSSMSSISMVHFLGPHFLHIEPRSAKYFIAGFVFYLKPRPPKLRCFGVMLLKQLGPSCRYLGLHKPVRSFTSVLVSDQVMEGQ